ncbi:MAG: methylmalonyl Co-A mutase-associated GTPase MeaB, partial [Candidatus Halalkalibacterium sp. M3_1C_030]
QAVREYKNALHLYPPSESGWEPKVTTCSALEGDGIEELWELINDYISFTKENGFFEKQRNRQSKHWMYETINNRLQDAFYNDPGIKKELKSIEKKVLNGEISSFKAAQKLLDFYNH